MWRTPRNVPAPATNEKDLSEKKTVTRRIEVTVERQVCSIEVHGSVALQYGSPCPVCGHMLAAPENQTVPELESGANPATAKDRGRQSRSIP